MDGPVQPVGWPRPRGYSNGYRLDNVLFVSGQVAWDAEGRIVGDGDFAAQFRQALANVCAVLDAAGVARERVGRVTVYVVEKESYTAMMREVGAIWRDLFGRHYPAMSLVQVAALLEPGALVEIEATAVVL
ncbi:MAG: RidA family protein [Myxococcales bacterium]|nr:RidA family protein [Myxococcales bacterium]